MKQGTFDPLLVDVKGHAESLLGNEAIVRGALEAGVAFACGYPGTPSSEVTDSFFRVAEQRGIVFEYSINEKIALEMAFAASLAGARSICAMKHLGLLYAGDPLSTIPYIGPRGGLVVVSAGDPSCRTSPNEQDQRLLAPMLFLPMLDPSTPQEALDMTKFAFELSEKSRLPVVLRPTTRVCHSRAVVRYQRLMPKQVGGFVRDPERLVPVPANARRMRIEIKDRLEIAEHMMAESGFLRVYGNSDQAVLASGAPVAGCHDVLVESDLYGRVRFISLGCIYPLPERRLLEALDGVTRLLVVEELSPYLEDGLRSLAARRGLSIEILGKGSGHFPAEFEYQPEQILSAIEKGLGLRADGPDPLAGQASQVPVRPPTLCPGCPHRASQFALRTVFGEQCLYFGDIGCYTLGYGPPLHTVDSLLCMGAGFTLAAGVSRITNQRTVGVMGDSTFFHSGMPALLNAVKEKVDMVAVILDNQVTAMTGFQESPGMKQLADGLSREVSIEAVVRSLGVKQVETVDPYDLSSTMQAFERARDAQGVSVVICERACRVHLARQTGQTYKLGSYQVDSSLCQFCGREASGQRCGQSRSIAFTRHMTQSRIQHVDCKSVEKSSQAPCSTRCPLGLCIQGYLGQIAAGQYKNAYEMILERVPMPETVCRVCHRPCEQACVHGDTDRAVGVNDLKRFVVDWAHRFDQAAECAPWVDCGIRIAVIGAGPAGLAAAYHLRLRGYRVVLFDAEEKAGGLLRYGIPAYRMPREPLDRDIERMLASGVEFESGRKLGENLFIEQLLDDGYAAVFLAIGAQKSIDLPVERDPDAIEQTDALTYLRAANRGGDVKTGKHVVVVGGGNAAVDAARTAVRRGAERVVIAYRRSRQDMPAWDDEIQAAESEGVEILCRLQPARARADGLLCVKTKPGKPDASGRSRPVAVADQKILIEAEQIITALGQRMDESWCASSSFDLEREAEGLVKIDPLTGRTSHAKIFAGGDMTPANRTVTEAMAAGIRSAWGIDAVLRGTEVADRRPIAPIVEASLEKRNVDRDQAECRRPANDPSRPIDDSEVAVVLTEFQARQEASRCKVCGLCGNCRSCLDLFGCPAFFVRDGGIFIDPELCMGCGVCESVCPNGAIREAANE